MATTENFINYVIENLNGIGNLRYRRMFGEYMVYLNDKPVLTVCDNTCYVKKLSIIEFLMKNAQTGYPYEGAKEHYILDIDDASLCKKVLSEIEKVTKVPKKKAKQYEKTIQN